MLSNQDFLFIVDNTPLVSIDLMVRSSSGELLLGYRINEPAQNTWFVPGGRIFKNETLAQAFARITSTELGLEIPFASATLRGGFTHIYDTNFMQDPGVGTHYVVLAYEFHLEAELSSIPTAQHSQYQWWSAAQAKESKQVHENTLAYFLLDGTPK